MMKGHAPLLRGSIGWRRGSGQTLPTSPAHVHLCSWGHRALRNTFVSSPDPRSCLFQEAFPAPSGVGNLFGHQPLAVLSTLRSPAGPAPDPGQGLSSLFQLSVHAALARVQHAQTYYLAHKSGSGLPNDLISNPND